jgi:hypothetical protein
VLPGHKAQQDHRDPQDLQVPRAFRETSDQRALREFKVFKVSKVKLDLADLRESRVFKDPLAPQVLRVFRDQLVQPVSKAQLAQPDRRATPAQQVLKVFRVSRALSVEQLLTTTT